MSQTSRGVSVSREDFLDVLEGLFSEQQFAVLSTNRVPQGELVTLTLVLRGSGNLESDEALGG